MRNKAGAWFNGVSSYVVVNPDVIVGQAFSVLIEAELRPSGRQEYYVNRFDKRNGFYIVKTRRNRLLFGVYGGGEGYILDLPRAYIDNTVHLIGFIVEYPEIRVLYDSMVVKQGMVDIEISPATIPLYIGAYDTSFSMYRGVITRFIVAKRVVELTEIMTGIKNVMIYHDYRLGHTLDLSGNGNHGIPYNVQFVGAYIKKGLWLPGQSDAYVEIPEAVINGDEDYTVAVKFADIQPGKLFQHGNDLIIELEGKTLKAYRINSASEQETVTYNLSQFSGMAIARKAGNNLELLWNGVSVGSVAVTGDVLPGTEWRIGNALRGNIKRVIAYQRALDNGEINQLLNRQLPPHPSLYYDFRLGHADDLSGHGRDGILHGELLWI